MFELKKQLQGEILSIKVKGFDGRVMHKDACNIFNPKDLKRLFSTLEDKFNLEITGALKQVAEKEKGWWDY